ncbi:transcription factor TGA2-like protein [Cinnamomum micranthum f. kanehirae]|uniref:Transcription factor TGA2-like protein n=1 Tax=Cinnamomum micranthum f. kanehirae TaxID=337451 RepID=A0A443PPX7_9MAGN|nr:transcription factor TGA2-like protein [Cinnamomum micranthum f. kanehirae]
MSELPERNDEEAVMSRATRNVIDLKHETFDKFYEYWLVEQDRCLQQLLAAARTGDGEEDRLRHLVNEVLRHYENYYANKSRSAKKDVLAVLSPSWTSTLEEAFLWIGGWRPTVAVHLLYSKASLQLEDQLEGFLRGISTGDLGDLSPEQLGQVDGLHRRTVREENKITEKMAKLQETVADSTMVRLSQAATEVKGEGGEVEEEVERALEKKKEGMEKVVGMADDLRMRTLKGVVEFLGPLQAVHYLIAAAELHLRFHEWGKKMDAAGKSDH